MLALDHHNINVRDCWKEKEQVSNINVLKQFSPNTKIMLLENIAPLMQWRDISKQAESLRFDVNIIAAQKALLQQANNSADLHYQKNIILEKVASLSMHLNQVRAKAVIIKKVQDKNFWDSCNFSKLEQMRVELRGIIHLRETITPTPQPLNVVDITENCDEIKVSERATNIRTVDYEIYRQSVEKTMAPLFETNKILQKIRAAQPIKPHELEELIVLVHSQNANVDLKLLKTFFPDSTASIDELLRTLIGLDKKAIEQTFTTFIQNHHLQLNSRQLRFLDLLKAELCKKGEITVEALYDYPFKSLHEEGIDGLFKEHQATLIAEFIADFAVDTGTEKSQHIILET